MTAPAAPVGTFALPCYRCQREVSSPWIVSTPDDQYVPVCDDCYRPAPTR